jgi:prenylcysteine oxidase / farnesylcysteine lyase
MFARFRRIYDLQSNGTSFDTPEELLRRVGLFELTQQSLGGYIEEVLGGARTSRRMARELVAAVNLVNYNQGNGLNAMAGARSNGAVCLSCGACPRPSPK